MIDCTDISSLLEGKIDNWEGTIDNNNMREKEKFWLREKTDGVETLSISLIDYFYPSVPSVQSSDLSSSQQTEPSSSQTAQHRVGVGVVCMHHSVRVVHSSST